MTKQLMIYERATPLSVAKHRDWHVKTGERYEFAQNVNAVPLMTTEFGVAAAEYAIVFAGEDRVMPAAILGVRNEENLFVGKDGRWRGHYVPAFLRQYPFVLAGEEGDETLTLCLDEEYSGCNREGRGERLFDADGERTSYLQNVLNFVQGYQRDFRLTRLFCDRLKELDLLEPMHAQFRLPSSEVGLQGFFAVSREKLKALPDAAVVDLCRSDGLEVIYAHLGSLRNFRRMVDLIGRGDAPATEPGAGDQEEATQV